MERTVIFWALEGVDVQRVRSGELCSESIWAESDLAGAAPPGWFYVGCGAIVWLAATGFIALPWMVNWGFGVGLGLSIVALVATAVGLTVLRRRTIRDTRKAIKLTLPDRYRFSTPDEEWIQNMLVDAPGDQSHYLIATEKYSGWLVSDRPAFAQYLTMAADELRTLVAFVR